jgi:hypothetical protein
MTIAEAATLLNKSERTIKRYKAEGCDVRDEAKLLLWSERMDARARGRAQKLWYLREDRAGDVTSSTPTLAKLLKDVPEGRYQPLPCPASYEVQLAVCEALDALAEAFRRRVEELEAIGHAHSLELANAEYRDIRADALDIRSILAGYDK